MYFRVGTVQKFQPMHDFSMPCHFWQVPVWVHKDMQKGWNKLKGTKDSNSKYRHRISNSGTVSLDSPEGNPFRAEPRARLEDGTLFRLKAFICPTESLYCLGSLTSTVTIVRMFKPGNCLIFLYFNNFFLKNNSQSHIMTEEASELSWLWIIEMHSDE